MYTEPAVLYRSMEELYDTYYTVAFCTVQEHGGAAPAADGEDGGALRQPHPHHQEGHRGEAQG